MKAVLVFCEGRHDVVFAQRSLGVHGGCQWVGRAIGELPSPFGRSRIARKGLIATRIERHAIEDLAIQAAAHSPLPSFESVVENTATDTIFFMVRANGKTQSDPIVSLLRALSVTLAGVPVGTFEVSEYAAAFLFDANGEGVASTLRDFGARYTSEFGDLSSVAHASWLDETTIPVGCFVFHKSSQDPTGTLEQHLRPMAAGAWPQQDAKAELFIDDARCWPDGRDQPFGEQQPCSRLRTRCNEARRESPGSHGPDTGCHTISSCAALLRALAERPRCNT